MILVDIPKLDPVTVIVRHKLTNMDAAELFNVSIDTVNGWTSRRRVAHPCAWVLAAQYDEAWKEKGCPYVTK